MYAICDMPPSTVSGIYRQYIQKNKKITSSTKKAWDNIQITISRVGSIDIGGDKNIANNFINAQQLAINKIWDNPENDIWDKLYEELNA